MKPRSWSARTLWRWLVASVMASVMVWGTGCVPSGTGTTPATAQAACAGFQPRLTLPFSDERRVIQGNHGAFSHTGRYEYAWDFAMREATPVLAAAPGVVVEVVDGFTEGGADHRLDDRANRILVDHGGARFGVYQHLSPHGAKVKEGQVVARGEALGLSGNTGFSSEPHLHFAVADARNRSQPACFVDAGDGGIPQLGHGYRALGQHDQDAAPSESTLPADIFAENGVVLDGAVPAHRWHEDLVLDGHTTRDGQEVVAFFMPRERDGRLKPFFAKVTSGHFRLPISLAALRDLGASVDFALVVRGADGRYHADFSVPLLVR